MPLPRPPPALLLLVALLAAPACRAPPAPPAYVRVEGAAPALAGVPDAPAHLVSFWATWCPPCRTETPGLRALAADPPAGLQVVVISHDADLAAVEHFLGGPPDPAWHLRLDADRTLGRAFGVGPLPDSFLVVRGRLVARFTGPRDWSSEGMRRLLARLVAEAR